MFKAFVCQDYTKHFVGLCFINKLDEIMFNPEVGGSYAEFLSHLYADSCERMWQFIS